MSIQTAPNKPPAMWRWLMKAQNPFMKWLLRSPFHFFVSKLYMLITFIGRKSGTVYTTPVQYARDGNMVYVITSEGYVWWKNLRGGAEVALVIRGRTYRGHADVSTSPDTINALIHKIYPQLSSERVQKFIGGKVAVTITLQNDTL